MPFPFSPPSPVDYYIHKFQFSFIYYPSTPLSLNRVPDLCASLVPSHVINSTKSFRSSKQKAKPTNSNNNNSKRSKTTLCHNQVFSGSSFLFHFLLFYPPLFDLVCVQPLMCVCVCASNPCNPHHFSFLSLPYPNPERQSIQIYPTTSPIRIIYSFG